MRSVGLFLLATLLSCWVAVAVFLIGMGIVDQRPIAAVIPFTPLVMIGMAVPLLPVLLLGSMMTGLSFEHHFFRHWLAWGAVGAIGGYIMVRWAIANDPVAMRSIGAYTVIGMLGGIAAALTFRAMAPISGAMQKKTSD